jgi:hypothetical protein
MEFDIKVQNLTMSFYNYNFLLKIFFFIFGASGRNLVNYRSRNRPETHALPA